jgi:hypothetical protein
MSKNTILSARQQALDFESNDQCRRLSDADHEQCRMLLTELLIEVIRVEPKPQEQKDE